MEQYKEDENPRVYGEYRYAQFVLFLIREYYPQHDELCQVEGMLLGQAVQGDETAKEALKLVGHRVEEFIDRIYEQN